MENQISAEIAAGTTKPIQILATIKYNVVECGMLIKVVREKNTPHQTQTPRERMSLPLFWCVSDLKKVEKSLRIYKILAEKVSKK